jgi:hypothetical protein
MRECDVWKNTSDADFENAMEGMEKLVMNRLYDLSVDVHYVWLSNDLTTLFKHIHSTITSR